MSNNNFDVEPKLMMSDALKEIIQEEEINDFDNSIFVTLENETSRIVAGLLSGLDLLANPKVDIKCPQDQAFSFINTAVSKNDLVIEKISLVLNTKLVSILGPFKTSNVKIFDIDNHNDICILAIDLIRI